MRRWGRHRFLVDGKKKGGALRVFPYCDVVGYKRIQCSPMMEHWIMFFLIVYFVLAFLREFSVRGRARLILSV